MLKEILKKAFIKWISLIPQKESFYHILLGGGLGYIFIILYFVFAEI